MSARVQGVMKRPLALLVLICLVSATLWLSVSRRSDAQVVRPRLHEVAVEIALPAVIHSQARLVTAFTDTRRVRTGESARVTTLVFQEPGGTVRLVTFVPTVSGIEYDLISVIPQ